MITRVLDAKGNVIHDCAREGCENSWDGYARKGGLKVQTGVALDGVTAVTATLSAGDALPNRADPDLNAWTIGGTKATLKNGNGQ